MKYSDDNTNIDGRDCAVDAEQNRVDAQADGTTALDSTDVSATALATETAEKKNDDNNDNCVKPDGNGAETARAGLDVGGLVAVGIKAIAVTLSVILLLTSLLAVALPLSAMRIFNKLGMTERAVDFGARYIVREIGAYDAEKIDDMGNFIGLANTPELTNDDFTEALYVCINNSYKLMNGYYENGKTARGEYYARLVEKYTRMYLSLNNVSGVNNTNSERDIAAMPLAAMRPVVYSYGHSVRTKNFRARSFLGETERAVFNSRINGNSVTELTTLSNTYYGLVLDNASPASVMSALDDYVDYAGQIGEYLDVEFLRAGVERDLSKTERIYVKVVDEWREVPVLSDTYIIEKYAGYLSGDEFSLFFAYDGKFSNIYNQLKRFNVYAQAAVDFTPSDANNNKLDEQLHQLYWLNVLSNVARKLWYMEKLMYQSNINFGVSSAYIRDDYNAWQENTFVKYDGGLRQIWEVYNIKLNAYTAQYQNGKEKHQ